MDEAQKLKEKFFETLYRQHHSRLLRQANAYFGYQRQYFHLAENAVQEAFQLAFEAYDSFHAHPNQGAWLTIVLRRRLYLYMQEVFSNQEHLVTLNEEFLSPLVLEDKVDEREKLLQTEENRNLVMRLMKQLNNKEKKIIHMFYYEKKSSAEIAKLFDTTDRVVNTQLYRIRKKMKKIYEIGVFLLIYLSRFYI